MLSTACKSLTTTFTVLPRLTSRKIFSTMSTRPREESPGGSLPVKRAKLEDDVDSRVAQEMALPIEYTKAYDVELDYRNKLVLAPMVRTGSRKSSLKLGADIQCRW